MSLTPINQKAHDISFAVFRVAAIMKNKELKTELENAAVALLAQVSSGNEGDTIGKMEALVSLAFSVGEMNDINSEVLFRELHNLQTALEVHRETANAMEQEANNRQIDISEIFEYSNPAKSSEKPEQIKETIQDNPKQTLRINPKFSPSPFSPINRASSPSIDVEKEENNSAENELSDRQATILKYVRNIPFCRMRNIMENMPDVSERTIRNDIQGLIEKQLIRRIGGGGPNSYFETMEMVVGGIAR